MTLVTEIYQFLFISSIVFMLYVFGDLIIKAYGRFRLKNNTRFKLTNFEKIALWFSIATFFTYIFS